MLFLFFLYLNEVVLLGTKRLTRGKYRLNLTAACRVYVMEPQWNPAAEAQAIDRIHRMGQKKKVVTVRYIMNDSFEEKILKIQDKKTRLANLTMESGKRMSKEQMAKLRIEVCTPVSLWRWGCVLTRLRSV